jgi:hypothetical protein
VRQERQHAEPLISQIFADPNPAAGRVGKEELRMKNDEPAFVKPEIRNPNVEIRNKSQGSKPEGSKPMRRSLARFVSD